MIPPTELPASRTAWLERRGLGTLLAAGFLAVLVAAVFGRSLAYGLISLDDAGYVGSNFLVRRGLTLQGVGWAFTTASMANWHPFTWLSYMADAQVWRGWMGGFHATNVLLHGLDAALVFVVLRRMTGAPLRSACVALLFAVHPLRAESVAWVSERKDVLSGLFFFLTLWCYVRFTERRTPLRALAVAAALSAGLLSKPMVVTTPFVLLLLDRWPLRRDREHGWGSLVAEKLPLLALCAVASAATLVAQRAGGAMASLAGQSLGQRAANAATAIPRYLWLTLWPRNLSSIYWLRPDLPVGPAVAGALLVAAITAVAVALRDRQPHLLTGWAWFVGMLIPTLGLVQVGQQAIADRYTYLPHVGLFIALVWAVPAPRSEFQRRCLAAATACLAAVLSVVCARQVAVWRSDAALAAQAVRAEPESPLALGWAGWVEFHEGRLEDARRHFEAALARNRNVASLHTGLGAVLDQQGDPARAIGELQLGLRLDPLKAESARLLGRALFRAGHPEETVRVLRQFLRDNPDLPERGRLDAELGAALGLTGRAEEGLATLRRAVDEQPDDANGHMNLGVALAQHGEFSAAAGHFRRALELDPSLAEARAMLLRAEEDAAAPAPLSPRR